MRAHMPIANEQHVISACKAHPAHTSALLRMLSQYTDHDCSNNNYNNILSIVI